MPDERLDRLATLVEAKKTTYLELKILDFPSFSIGKKGPPPALLGTLATAEKLEAMPLWLFHGGKDDVVPPSESRSLFAALGAPKKDEPGVKVCYTEFPDANHNSWDAAYGDPELAAWLVRHTR